MLTIQVTDSYKETEKKAKLKKFAALIQGDIGVGEHHELFIGKARRAIDKHLFKHNLDNRPTEQVFSALVNTSDDKTALLLTTGQVDIHGVIDHLSQTKQITHVL